MDDRIGISISVDSPLDETLNRGPQCCSCGNRMNFPLGLLLCNFHFSTVELEDLCSDLDNILYNTVSFTFSR